MYAGSEGKKHVYKGPAKTSSIIIVISSDPNDFYTISLAKSNRRERIVFKFRLTSVWLQCPNYTKSIFGYELFLKIQQSVGFRITILDKKIYFKL
jgi:hypothetical protein